MIARFLLALWLSHAPADAVKVSTTTCPGLDAAEVERLVELELAAVTQEIRDGPPLRVVLTCASGRLAIAVTDPMTSKQLERTVPAPDDAPGRERVVALAISQLFAASWLELLIPEPQGDDGEAPPSMPRPAAGTSEAALEAATDLAHERTVPARERRVELLAGAGLRGRALESAPFSALHLDLETRAWLAPRIGIAGRLDFDLGRALRSAGQVRGLDVLGGGGLVWRSSSARVAMGGAVLMGLGWARLQGVAQRDEVSATARDGLTGQALVTVGPRIRASRLRIDVDAEFGGMLRSPRGLVSGEPSVSMGGMFVGLALRLGGALGRS